MKKILSAALVAVLTSCATAPGPARAAVAAPVAPAPAAVAGKEVAAEVPLPVSIKSYYQNGDPSGTTTTKYDARGFLLSQETRNGNGVLVETRTGKAKDGLWRITVTNAQTGDVLSFEDRTTGPQGELLVQSFLTSKEVPQASNEYSYDKAGRRVLWLAKAGGGGLQARTVYSYDALGNNIRTELFDAGGTLANVFVSTYEGNHILSRQGFDASQNLVEQTNYTWKDGHKVKEETVKPLLRTIEYTYDEKGAPTGIISSVRGKVVERQTLDYQWFTKTKNSNP